MDHPNDTTEHIKNKHLTYDDRMTIQLRLKDGWSPYKIAKDAIHCAANTVRNEIHRGTVLLYNGKIQRYKAKAGQAAYEAHRLNSRKCYSCLAKAAFLHYANEHFHTDHWSPDACVGRAITHGGFSRNEIVCTKTLYNYIDAGLMGIKNIDLPQKLLRRPKKHRTRENKKALGRSIEERSENVETREVFGHWESDLVIGSRDGNDAVLLTLLERKSRNLHVIQIANKTASAVMQAFQQLQMQYGAAFGRVFQTITTDNGSEFSRLSELESVADTLVYYAHPFSSWEKGSNEMHNGLLRRFIPKGKRIDSYNVDDVYGVEMWCNQLPRKILGYRTPEEVFEDELDLIYAV